MFAMITCFECGQPAEHNHHVVPRVMGGTRTVPLCAGCHAKVHHTDRQSLQRAGIAKAKRAIASGERQSWYKARRPRKVTTEVERAIRERLAAGASVQSIAEDCGVSSSTINALKHKTNPAAPAPFTAVVRLG
jgi:hypothetical protein